MDSIKSSELSPASIRPPVDINTSNAFQLMTVRGINQELAAAIVDYRQRRGDFFAVEDLLKVLNFTLNFSYIYYIPYIHTLLFYPWALGKRNECNEVRIIKTTVNCESRTRNCKKTKTRIII